MSNPFLVFEVERADEIFTETKQDEQTFTEPVGDLKIKRRRLVHKRNFGRGANHPSFFLRKFFSKLPVERYQQVYADFPNILQRVLENGDQTRGRKTRFNLDDLNRTFGMGEGADSARECYLNARMFYKVISQLSLELIMEESKCSQVLNHLISIEKYSSRLGNPKLTARVEFQ